MKKAYVILCICIMSILVVACSDKGNIEDDIHQTLSDIVSAEKGIDELQQNINTYAENEKDYYDQIISLPVEDHDQLENLIEQAEKELANSEETIKTIQEQLIESKEMIALLPEYTDELDSTEKQNAYKDLYDLTDKRANTLDMYYSTYLEALQTSNELYQLILTDGLQANSVYDSIEAVNDIYDHLIEINEEVNTYTSEVNEQKGTFYELING